jgi:hypothetical protein
MELNHGMSQHCVCFAEIANCVSHGLTCKGCEWVVSALSFEKRGILFVLSLHLFLRKMRGGRVMCITGMILRKSKGRGDHVEIRTDPCRVNIDKLRIPLYCNVDKLTTC